MNPLVVPQDRMMQEQFQLFLENTPDIIYIFDTSRRKATFFNREELFGYDLADLRGPRSIFAAVHPDDQHRIEQHWSFLAQAKPGTSTQIEYRLQTRYGRWEWVRSRETVLETNEEGQATQVLVVLSLITEWKEREAALKQYTHQLEQRTQRLLLISEMALSINRPVELDTVSQIAVTGLTQVLNIQQAALVLLDEQASLLTVMADQPAPEIASIKGQKLPLRHSPLKATLLNSESTILLTDVRENPDMADFHPLMAFRRLHALLIAPLRVNQTTVGFLICETSHRSEESAQEEIQMIQILGNLVSAKIEQLRLLETERELHRQSAEHASRLRRRESHLTILHSITQATTHLDTPSMLQTVVNRLGDLSGADSCFLTLWEEEQQRVIPQVAYGPFLNTYSQFQAQPDEATLTAAALKAGRPVLVEDVENSDLIAPRIAAQFPAKALLGVPLLSGGEKLGALIVSFDKTYQFDEEEIALYEQIAAQIALAISKSRLFQATRRQLEELRVLHRLTTASAAATSEDSLLEEATRILANTFYPNNFGVLLVDEARSTLWAHPSYRRGVSEEEGSVVPLGRGICGRVAVTGQSERVSDVRQIPHYFEVASDTRSELCVPLKSGKRVIGVVNAESDRLDAFTEADERLLVTFSNQLATAMERLRLLELERKRRREAESVRDAAASLTATLDLDQVLDLILLHLEEVMPYNSAEVFLLKDDRLTIVASHGSHGSADLIGQTFPAANPLFDQMSDTLQPVCLIDAQEDDRFHRWGAATHVRGWMGVPLVVHNQSIGCFALNSQQPGVYGENEAALARTFANQAAVAVENARLFAEAQQRTAELELLSTLSADLRQAEGAAAIMEQVLERLLLLLNANHGAIAVPEENAASDMLRVVHEHQSDFSFKPFRFPIAGSIFGHVYTTATPYLVTNLHEEELAYEQTRQAWLAFTNIKRALMYAPLKAGEQVIGIIMLGVEAPRTFNEEDLRLLTAVAEIAGNALHRARLMETLEQRVEERTRELARANEQLKELDRLKSKFISDVSHELRTPTTSLSLYMDLYERGRPEHKERYWTVLRQQTQRLSHLIEDILNLSRLELGRIEQTFERIDLNLLVAEVLESHRAEVEAAGLGLVLKSAIHLPPVWGLRDQLARAVGSLLTNAIRYTPQGQIQVSTGRAEQGQVVLQVKDSGVGIGPEDLEHLFERFYRGSYASQSNIPGTGLGLAIVKEIVNLHQGQITVESEEGRGTVFQIWLPPLSWMVDIEGES